MIDPFRLQAVIAFARREIGAVVALLVLAVATNLFLSVAGEVREQETGSIDRRVLIALRVPGHPGTPIGPHWLVEMARDLTSLGSIAVLSVIVLIVVGLVLSLRQRREALVLLIAAGGGLVMTAFLKDLFGRARPEAIYRAVEVSRSSFPSGHAMLSAVVYLSLGALCAGYVRPRLVKTYIMAVAMTLTLLVGVTRIYLGVHWMTDVLAGWSVGAAWATACWLGAWLWEGRWRDRPPRWEAETAPDDGSSAPGPGPAA